MEDFIFKVRKMRGRGRKRALMPSLMKIPQVVNAGLDTRAGSSDVRAAVSVGNCVHFQGLRLVADIQCLSTKL